MARLTKEVLLEGNKKVTVKEFTVKEIKRLWKELVELGSPQNIMSVNITAPMSELWVTAIDGLSIEEVDDFTPSDLKQVYDAFAEVNATFFDLASQVEDVNPMFKNLRLAIVSDLIVRFADSSKEAIPESGITDTVSS